MAVVLLHFIMWRSIWAHFNSIFHKWQRISPALISVEELQVPFTFAPTLWVYSSHHAQQNTNNSEELRPLPAVLSTAEVRARGVHLELIFDHSPDLICHFDGSGSHCCDLREIIWPGKCAGFTSLIGEHFTGSLKHHQTAQQQLWSETSIIQG